MPKKKEENITEKTIKSIVKMVAFKIIVVLLIILLVFALLVAVVYEVKISDIRWDEADGEGSENATTPSAYFNSIYVTENGT